MRKSDFFILGSAILSMGLSIYLWITGETDTALFVGLWVPSILGFGNYLKLKYQVEQ